MRGRKPLSSKRWAVLDMIAQVHPDLRRHQVIAVGSCAALAVAGFVALRVVVVGGEAVSGRLFLLLFTLVSLAVAYLGLFVVPRWYRRATVVVASVAPVAGVVTLTRESDSDSTSLYAAVSFASAPGPAAVGRIPLLMPAWSVDALLDAPTTAQLFIDPRTQKLMAISTPPGYLWCMPSGQVLPQQGTA